MYSAIGDARGNQMLNEDKAYFTSDGGSVTPDNGGEGGGGSGC